MNPFSVYGLVCPITQNIFYVGVTCRPNIRLCNHIAVPSSKPMAKYMKILKRKNALHKVKMQILESDVSLEMKDAVEAKWIDRIGKFKLLMNFRHNPRKMARCVDLKKIIVKKKFPIAA